MEHEEFTQLALKALKNEASAEELAALRQALAEMPSRQVEMNEWRETLTIVGSVSPLISAPDPSVELPGYRAEQLHSEVRKHFQKEMPSAARRWVGGAWFRFAFGSGVAVMAVVLILFLMPEATGIEVGYYSQPLERGASGVALVPASKNVVVHEFENDQEFSNWLTKPFASNEKARVWIDNEHDLIHVRLRPTFFHSSREWTRPLPESWEAQHQTIEALLKEDLTQAQ